MVPADLPADARPDAPARDHPAEVSVYPARVERAGTGRPSSPSQAYRLADDPVRAAALRDTAGSRRMLARPQRRAARPQAWGIPLPAPAPAPAPPPEPPPAPAPTGPLPLAPPTPPLARSAPLPAPPPGGGRHLGPSPGWRRLLLGALAAVRRRARRRGRRSAGS